MYWNLYKFLKILPVIQRIKNGLFVCIPVSTHQHKKEIRVSIFKLTKKSVNKLYRKAYKNVE